MISDKLFGLTMIFYWIAFLTYMIFIAFKQTHIGKSVGYTASFISWLALCLHTSAFGFRWFESYQQGIGHIPLSNMYESLIFFSWSIMLIYLILELRYGNHALGVVSTSLSALGLAILSLFPKAISPLVPALQSNWLTAHVITCFFGYAAFALGFGVSIIFIVQYFLEKFGRTIKALPKGYLLDEINYKSIAIGFPMLTIGIFTGAVWADYAWGTYWSWDPKETWSLITWLVYALYLHSRLKRGWRGMKSALLSIIGFLFVLFTYFGVNYLLSGLHSYA